MVRKYPEISSVFELSLTDVPVGESGAVLWDEVFGVHRPLRVEIGVGNSTFLIDVALKSPHFNYIGFEYSRKRVLKFLKKVEIARIAGIRMMCIDAELVIASVFEPGSVDHFYVNHPDPWPKRRHAKKRFVRPENARVMLRLLAPQGGISLRTDDPSYARQMLEVLDATEGLVNLSGQGCFAPRPTEDFTTYYEAKFRKEGRRIHYLEYSKRCPP